MMRKKPQQDQIQLDRWLVSYADLITLLLGFFVVMFAVSSINEEKYNALSDGLSDAFSSNSQKAVASRSNAAERGIPAGDNASNSLGVIATDFRRAMSPFIERDMVQVRRDDLWVEVEINTEFMFPSGSAELEEDAVPVLQQVAQVLRRYPNAIQVEGFTDNRPISTAAFPSNWELSAARAASVVHLFMNQGVKPVRMSAIGYGQYHPKSSNDTPEGRRKNRRVAVVVLVDDATHRVLETER